jgi:opacity protein-like surface antigen
LQHDLQAKFCWLSNRGDIAKLNLEGWNLHLGTTLGYMGTTGNIEQGVNITAGCIGGPSCGVPAPFNTQTQAPFFGLYGVATHGGFFADGMARLNYYSADLNSPLANLNQQKVDAHGASVGGNIGYHWPIPQSNVFLEPSLGLTWSQTSIGALQTAGIPFPGFGFTLPGTTRISDITSVLGRAGIRVGTTVGVGDLVFQPFAAVNVWHDFDGGWTATWSTTPGTFPPTPITAVMNGSSVGTYGTYSLGFSGQLRGTGWLGYARVDYENGANIQGWIASGGLRYQFTPDAAVPTPMITKVPVKAPPATYGPVNWSGFYIGGFGGAAYGRNSTDFAPAPAAINNGSQGFINIPGFGPVAITNPFPGASTSSKLGGILGGGQVGYNYQVGKWVWGLSADWGATNIRGSEPCGSLSQMSGPFATSPANALFNVTCSDQLSWVLTTTGRIGYAVDRSLYYAKVGPAWSHENFSVTCNGIINAPFIPISPAASCLNTAGVIINNTPITAGTTRVGWTVDGGFEFALAKAWSTNVELD